ncbi:3-hydroxyacyl-CoA dehydrogenase [soil metagenome]
MNGSRFNSVAVVGAGLVGSAWSIIFALAGLKVRVFDADAAVRGKVLERVRTGLADMERAGLASAIDAALARVTISATLAEAVSGADSIQESAFETVPVKTAISREIGAAMRADAICGSSSSGIPASAFTAEVKNRNRFLIAHPVNPPHLVPIVELVPAPWTDPDVVPAARALMERIGQAPISVNREVEGFILNRLQGALLMEAFALYEEGYASAADIDTTISQGLGLRWAFMGPFETIDLNAPGGVADYARRFGPLYARIAASRATRHGWSEALVGKVAAERRAAVPADRLAERRDWRDRRLMALAAHLRKTKDD